MDSQKKKHSILVVDDEPEMLVTLRGLLRKEFEVHTAESGREAIELLQQHPIHVIMTDQRMPEMTGVELLSRVQGTHPDAIRMVFTGYADIKAVIEAINQGGVFRYLTKPWDPEELLVVLRLACEEYERIVERHRLHDALRDYLARSLAFEEGLKDGQAGTLESAARSAVERLIEDGQTLCRRLEEKRSDGPEDPSG